MIYASSHVSVGGGWYERVIAGASLLEVLEVTGVHINAPLPDVDMGGTRSGQAHAPELAPAVRPTPHLPPQILGSGPPGLHTS